MKGDNMRESLRKNKTGILLMILSSLFVCIGQLFWKLSLTNSLLYITIGFVCYGIGAIVMLIAYKYGSLSVLQPMLSLNYVLSIFLAVTILNENLNLVRILGILITVVGVILIGGGDD